jgi:long-chain fatty acid transport protein
LWEGIPRRWVLGLAIGLTLFCRSGFGSGFSIAELGAKASGMGTAFTAIADDASALFYNPAGIAFQPGMQVQMDTLGVIGLFRFLPASPPSGTVVPPKGFSGATRPHLIPVSNLFGTYQIKPKWTVGFGAFTPFGLSDNFTNFNDGDPPLTKFPGRFVGSRARLESIWFQPTVAWRATPNTGVALGVALVHTHLFLEQSILNPVGDGLDFGREAAAELLPGVDKEQAARLLARLLPEGRSRVAGTARSPGFTLSYLYKHPGWKTNFGVMYRSAVVHHLKGEAAFAFTDSNPLGSFIGEDFFLKAFPNQKATGSFATPATFAVGVSHSGHWNSTFAIDFRVQDYHRFSDVVLNFSRNPETDPDAVTPAEKRIIYDFRNSFQLAVGFERPWNPATTIRAGYMFDHTPVVDKSVGPVFPDTSRHSFTGGVSRRRGSLEFTLFYQAVKFVHRTVDVAANANLFTNGEYRNFVHVVGLGLRFGRSERIGRTQ